MNYLLEITVILLLGITVAFCWRLNNKITEIKSSRKDMANLIKVFDDAIINTNNSLAALKEASADTARDLKKYTIKSNDLISELAFMNDTAVRLADRLESILSDAKEVEARCVVLIEGAKAIKEPVKKKISSREVVRKVRMINTPLKLNNKKIERDDLTSTQIVKKKVANRK